MLWWATRAVLFPAGFAGLMLVMGAAAAGQEQAPPGRAVPWLASRIQGTPNPPLPYATEQIFENVKLEQPTEIVWLPDASRWIATQVDGRIVTFAGDESSATVSPLLDLNALHAQPIHRAFAMAFHPDLKHQPWCYATYSSVGKSAEGSHLVRFKVIDPAVPTIDPASHVELAHWSSAGHAGGCMVFGPDGYFYFSVGDGQSPYPPDVINTGQDRSDLEASVLRIDVNDPTPDQPYRIPADNPFVGEAGVREEIWAFGFRNPWKLAFHPDTGDLFAGDVGWELREMVYRVQRGGNYGWSIKEGSQDLKPGQTPAIPITPPLVEHTHVESRSVTGGHVWQSDRLPELKGAYIYGDWMTGKVWGLKSEGDRVLWHQELVDTPLQIISFMLDPSGEVFIVGYDGTILRLHTNTETAENNAFPKRLSETGLFRDAARQQPEAGVVEYEISAQHWADGTHARQWIAIPGNEQLGLFDTAQWEIGQVEGRFEFPHDTVLAKTVSYLAESEQPASQRHLETQILHRLGNEWQAYNYVWNDAQTDALLQDDVATERRLSIREATGVRQQTWHHSSRSECLLCHLWSAGTVHGFVPGQLNYRLSSGDDTQLQRLSQEGLFARAIPAVEPIVSPTDPLQSLQARARAYLELNCATCHRPAGGGAANVHLDYQHTGETNNDLASAPSQGTFGLPDARIVAPGDPYRSVLLYRFLKSGRGHMPQFGSSVLDREGAQLLRDWIVSMPGETAAETEANRHPLETRIAQLNEAKDVDTAIRDLLSRTDGAVALSFACCGVALTEPVKARVIELGAAQSDPIVRDLFEHLLPEEQRIQRLGTTFSEEELLAAQGSVQRGWELFALAQDVNCRNCHKVGDVGQAIGPDLSGIGTQQTKAELLASLVRPSERVDPKYRGTTIVTVDGVVLTGVVTEQSDTQLTLADPTGKLLVVPQEEIELLRPADKSIMPEMLLAGLTQSQAADLLALLMAQQKIGPLQHRRATIRRAEKPPVIDGKLDEPDWQKAESVGEFVFTWSNEGDGPRQQTDARLLWDDEYLYVSFACEDKNIQGTRTLRDSDVYRDDCVEVFASPEIKHPENYFNLEMNVRGAQLDNYRPQGKNPEQEWNPEGIRLAVVLDGTLNDDSDVDRGWTLEVAIPFRLFAAVLPDGHPHAGDQWRLNLNRLEDNMGVKSQWSQGDRNVPSFHKPEFFGFVEFVE